MKMMKKLLSLTLAIVMVLSLAVTAFAEETTYKITIKNDKTGHTYEAYQIFAGDLLVKENKDKILSNIVWGAGVNSETLMAALKKTSPFTNCETAADVAELLKTESDAKAFAEIVGNHLTTAQGSSEWDATTKYTISGLPAGYYLVKDKDNSIDGAEGDAYTDFIIEVVGDAEAEPKSEIPSLTKQIKHNELDPSDENAEAAWGPVGDNQIGDEVFFRTISDVPDKTESFETYTYIIHDTMGKGLTSNVVTDNTNNNVTVKVNNETALDSKYITVEADGNTFSVKIDVKTAITAGDLKETDKLYTYYSGILNDEALIYDEGKQENTAYLEYSNNPHDDTDTTDTKEVVVYDWTFKTVVKKVDGAATDTQLEGAIFVLSEKSDLTLSYADGTVTPSDDLIKLVDAGSGVYRVATDEDATTTYTFVAGNPTIKGLDDETDYYLYEVKAPDGYNLVTEPVHIRISADGYGTAGSTRPTVKVSVDGKEQADNIPVSVVNNSGAKLPETGGIGTTIFYIVGGLLTLGAVVLLVTKKKMSAAE